MIQKEFARSKDQTQYHIPFLLEGAVFGEWERFSWLKGTCLSKVKQSLQRPSDFQKCQGKSWKKFLAKQMTSSAKSGVLLALGWRDGR